MKQIFCVLLISLSFSLGYCNQEEKQKDVNVATSNIDDPREFLPFEMALPRHFVFHQIKGCDWILYGEKNTLKELESQFEKNLDSAVVPTTGVVRMQISDSVGQTGEQTFSGSDDVLRREIKKMGGTNIHIKNLTWGNHPLKIVEATIRGAPLRTAWIGLNCGGPVLLVNYLFPQGKKSYKDDFDIWNRFLSDTRARSQEEINAIFSKVNEGVENSIKTPIQ